LLYIDLYLSEHLTIKYAQTDKPHIRMTEAPLRGHQITNARYVLSSHKHSDHLDPVALPEVFAASPEAKLLLPAALLEYTVGLGLPAERLIGSDGESTYRLGTAQVQTIPSAHPGLDRDPQHGYLFQGFLIEMDGVRIYHSGDTLVYPGLSDRLRVFGPDIAFLPINGTDARRDALGVPPNMNGAEALQLAQAAKLRLVIPHHYDMFTFNTADVLAFEALAKQQGIHSRTLHPGERFLWTP
jgi:L-ascorbate metabolism protein UlaG (beta-lactamase superfamily)